MEIQKQLTINDYVSEENGMVLPLRFTLQDGWYPLLAVPSTYRGASNPYFPHIHNTYKTSRVRLNMKSSGMVQKYKKGRSRYSQPVILYSGFLSAMGSTRDFEYMPSKLTGDDIHYRMKAEMDIFCLAVVRASNLPQVGNTNHQVRSRYVKRVSSINTTIDLTKVKIFVSTEKLRKSLFMKECYTATIRSTILTQIKRLDTETAITVEDVSEDYLNGFVVSPNAVRTNSIVEIIQLDNEIKDSVFSNLNKVAI